MCINNSQTELVQNCIVIYTACFLNLLSACLLMNCLQGFRCSECQTDQIIRPRHVIMVADGNQLFSD